jgi:Flp pilus assembly pilin Flp
MFDTMTASLRARSGLATSEEGATAVEYGIMVAAIAALIIAIVFMILGALPFMLYIKAVRGAPMALFRDDQVRAFFVILGGLIILCLLAEREAHLGPASVQVREAVFNMVSIMTGTGYASTDFNLWGPFAVGLFFGGLFLGPMTICAIQLIDDLALPGTQTEAQSWTQTAVVGGIALGLTASGLAVDLGGPQLALVPGAVSVGVGAVVINLGNGRLRPDVAGEVEPVGRSVG